MHKRIRFIEGGRVPYESALEKQRELAAEVAAGGAPVLLSIEHPPVYTLGRRDTPNQFRTLAREIPIVKTDRGGEITYHGPGQSVVYILVPLDRWRLTLPNLVHEIEGAIIDDADMRGIMAERVEGWRGVFSESKKLASIGLAVHRDVTMHGLAINVDNDLEPFSRINPCGLPIEMFSYLTLGVDPLPQRDAVGRSIALFLAKRLKAQLDPA